MKSAWHLLALTVALFASLPWPRATAAIPDSVKFTPTINLLECPAAPRLRADCLPHEQQLPMVEVPLLLQIGSSKIGSWDYQTNAQMAAAFHVIVLMDHIASGVYRYSVSLEAGPSGIAPPYTNARTEFLNTKMPDTMVASTPPQAVGGKIYVLELTLKDFHAPTDGTKAR